MRIIRSSGRLVLWALPLVLALGAGCSKSGNNGNGSNNNNNNDGGTGNANPNGLTISPADPVLTAVPGMTPPTVQFNAAIKGQSVVAHWSLDRGEIGTIDVNGLFTATGTLGGVVHVVAKDDEGDTAQTTVTVKLTASDNGDPAWSATPAQPGPGGYGGVGGDGPGGPVDGTTQGAFGGTATVDPSVKLLYPYDGTVWPRGLLAPLLQWDSGGHHFTAAHVHVQENNYQYDGYFKANNGTTFANLPLPQKAWEQLTYSNAGEQVTLSISFTDGTAVYGPYSVNWKIAQATLRGTIYYNSYGTYLATNSATDGLDVNGKQYGAATLAIKVGQTSPTLVAGVDTPAPGGDGRGCRVCHTVSANGKVLVTQASNLSASDYSDTKFYDLLNDTTGRAGTDTATPNLTYPALSPDGKLLFASSGGLQYSVPAPSRLFALPAGSPVTTSGLSADFQAALPMFSPDGKHLAFNFWSGTLGSLTGDQRSLAVLDFDGTNTFSNPRVLYTPANNKPVTFSSFLPNGGGIVFQIELDNPSTTWGGTWKGDKAELWLYDYHSNSAHRLDQLNGINLPSNALHPAGLDTTLNYEPTINPIASGGYAWVVFTSRRMYGNVAAEDPWMSDPRHYDATTHITDKKLWVAAVDLNTGEFATNPADPSHPAFYLPAQEIHAGNSRGFWSVDPCLDDGKTCDTGDECCGGYCSTKNGAPVCSSDKPMCAAEFDKCEADADCCVQTPALGCINHVCTQTRPIE